MALTSREAPSGKAYEHRLIAVLTVVGGVAALDTQAVFYLLPFITPDLGLNNSQVGLIGSAVVVGWSLSALVVALISDRLGRRKPFLIGAFLAFAALSGLSALAATFVQLLAARFLVGLAEGPVLPMQHSLVMTEGAPARRGLYMGLVQNLGAQLIGTLMAPIALVWLAERSGWRASFLVAAVPGLLAAALLFFVIREPVAKRDTAGQMAFVDSLRVVWASRNVRLCIAIGSCCVAWYFLLLTFVPLWLTRQTGMSAGAMSLMVSLIGAAGAAGGVLVAGLSDRIGRRQAITLFCALGALAPLAVMLLGGSPLLLGATLFIGALMIGAFSIFMGTLPQESVPLRNGATATALVMCVSQLVGGVAGPAVGGVLADRIAPSAPLVLAAGLAVLAALLSFAIRNPERT